MSGSKMEDSNMEIQVSGVRTVSHYTVNADPMVRAAYEAGWRDGGIAMRLKIQQNIAGIGRGVKNYCNY